jgi:membrane protein DedA with SNARE-associated domain
VDWLNQITDAISGSWWAYPLIFIISLGDAVLPFLPSETAVVTGGVLSAGNHGLSLPLVMLSGAVGAFLGDSTSYAIGHWAGPWAKKHFFSGKRGQKSFYWASEQLKTRGAEIIVVARFIPLGRTATTLVAGMSGYPYSKFAPAAATGAIIWASYNALLGRIGGAAFESNTSLALLVAFGSAVTGTLLIELVRHQIRKRGERRRASAGARDEVSGAPLDDELPAGSTDGHLVEGRTQAP